MGWEEEEEVNDEEAEDTRKEKVAEVWNWEASGRTRN